MADAIADFGVVVLCVVLYVRLRAVERRCDDYANAVHRLLNARMPFVSASYSVSHSVSASLSRSHSPSPSPTASPSPSPEYDDDTEPQP